MDHHQFRLVLHVRQVHGPLKQLRHALTVSKDLGRAYWEPVRALNVFHVLQGLGHPTLEALPI